MDIPIKVKPGEEVVIRLIVEAEGEGAQPATTPRYFGTTGTERGERVLLLYNDSGKHVTRRRFTDRLIDDLALGVIPPLSDLPNMRHRATWDPFQSGPEDAEPARRLIARLGELSTEAAPHWKKLHRKFLRETEEGRTMHLAASEAPEWLVAEDGVEYTPDMGEPYHG